MDGAEIRALLLQPPDHVAEFGGMLPPMTTTAQTFEIRGVIITRIAILVIHINARLPAHHARTSRRDASSVVPMAMIGRT